MKPFILRKPGESRERRLASHNHSGTGRIPSARLQDLQRGAAAMQASQRVISAQAAVIAARHSQAKLAPSTLSPVDWSQAANDLRPSSLDQMVGQEKLKPLLRRLVVNVKDTGKRLPHLLLVGASGTGKTTVGTIVARELNARCFVLKAPLDMGTLDALREGARDGDVVFVDEIHMQVSGDRRGITQACDPEAFFLLLEDGVLATARGPQPFPDVTWIGATTDVGLLPEPLSNRFPLQPRLAPYTEEDMKMLAYSNAAALGLGPLGVDVASLFAHACRANPRQLNSYMRSAEALGIGGSIDEKLATEVVCDLAGCTLDGLTPSMQTVLRYLYVSCKREYRDGRVIYSASVNQLATACGHGRDTKAIALLVEPYLIQAGLLGISHTGRALTAAGIRRAKEL